MGTHGEPMSIQRSYVALRTGHVTLKAEHLTNWAESLLGGPMPVVLAMPILHAREPKSSQKASQEFTSIKEGPHHSCSLQECHFTDESKRLSHMRHQSASNPIQIKLDLAPDVKRDVQVMHHEVESVELLPVAHFAVKRNRAITSVLSEQTFAKAQGS